jgi:hypothetical protein
LLSGSLILRRLPSLANELVSGITGAELPTTGKRSFAP